MEQITPVEQNIINQALNIYCYGSFVYGTYQEGISDKDFIVIVPDKFYDFDLSQFEQANNQYSIYTKSTWQKKLDNNDVDAIETYFLPDKYKVKETEIFKTNINPEKIRENFSRVSSNSFVKCKKKLTVEKDYNPRVGKKSLWHSLRIVDFGIQILKHGYIKNYSSMNHFHDEIVNNKSNDWNIYKEKYQSIYNALKTEFRLAEKEKAPQQEL
jgi:hypothetical protein